MPVVAHTVHVPTDEHGAGPARHWTVKLRLAIDAEREPEARAIAEEVIQAMDVGVSSALEVARSASHRPFWDIVTNLELSAAGFSPDDALTRFRFVIRNLPRVTFMSPSPGNGSNVLYQWLPDEWGTAQNYEELVHPAVRAAGVWVSASSED